MAHATIAEIEEALPWLRESPRDDGSIELIVWRPSVEEREVLEEGELDMASTAVCQPRA